MEQYVQTPCAETESGELGGLEGKESVSQRCNEGPLVKSSDCLKRMAEME